MFFQGDLQPSLVLNCVHISALSVRPIQFIQYLILIELFHCFVANILCSILLLTQKKYAIEINHSC